MKSHLNPNGQQCYGHCGVSGTDHGQYAYKTECTICGYGYGSNGSDVFERRCPKCQKGTVIKGKTRYGCTQYTDGCTFAIPFDFMGKKISDNQVKRLVEKGSTVKLKGFKSSNGKVDGMIVLGEDKQLLFKSDSATKSNDANMPACPKCRKGTLIKGKTAYGCSLWKSGCDFRYSFADIKAKAGGRKMTRELVLEIISS